MDVVYSSAPAGEVIIPTLEIRHATAFDPIRICTGFEDISATIEDDEVVTFIASGFDLAKPSKDTSGQQVLTFAIDNVAGQAEQAVDAAIKAGGTVSVIYREYLYSDLSAPAEPPLYMTMVGGSFEGSTVQIQAAYFDLLNTAWPRYRYNLNDHPALAFM